jgi:hypothetical protein
MQDIEESGPENGKQLDLVTARALSAFSRSTSRRGFLAGGWRLFLKGLGISVFPLLPLYRVIAQSPPTQDCQGDWQYCGQHGNFCQACCGGAAAITSCPVCTSTGSSWSACCCCPGCNSAFTILYVDCCGLVACPSGKCPPGTTYTAAQAADCKGADCRRVQRWGWWCGLKGVYRCTIINQTTPCSDCKS